MHPNGLLRLSGEVQQSLGSVYALINSAGYGHALLRRRREG